MEYTQDKRGFHIEKSISIGHILTTFGLVIAAFTWTTQVDKKLAVHDVQIIQIQDQNKLQQDEARTSRAEILNQLQSINDKLDRTIENRGKK